MKSIKNLFKTFLLALVLVSCETEDKCGDLLCSTGPVVFSFTVVDKLSGENLFTTGQFESRDIHIENLEGESVDFELRTESDLDRIYVLLGEGSKTDTFTIGIGNDIEFKLSFVLEKNDGCCKNTLLKELNIEGVEYERSETTGIIQILVETEENIYHSF